MDFSNSLMNNKSKVCVFGLGYIGLPTSLLLADSGHQVIGVDVNQQVVNSLKANKVHIKEPSLKNILSKSLSEKTFIPSHKPEKSDIFLIAVPTPFCKGEYKIPTPDISYIESAINMIIKVLEPDNLIIIESTSPVGTTENIYNLILEKTDLLTNQIQISYCPERVLPGQIIKELINNNRVIGGINEKSSLSALKFYKTFCKGEITITNSRTAELIKLTENAFRDINIAFANEISMICYEKKISTSELIRLANQHPRVNILDPGCGVGGHCIAVDPWFIASQDPFRSQLIQTARKVNNSKTEWCIEVIRTKYKSIKSSIKREPTIGCLGLTYKPDVDDIRESPALKITEKIKKEGFKIIVCEPNMESYKDLQFHDINYILEKADLILILVAHSQFKSINFSSYEVIDFCYLNN